MFVNTSRYVDFLVEHDISADQFILMWLIYRNDMHSILRYNEKGPGFRPSDVRRMIERGWLIDLNEGDEKMIIVEGVYKLLITESFRELILIDSDEALDDLWKLYPPFIDLDGKRVPAKSVDKDRLAADYGRIIQNDVYQHRYVKRMLEEAVKAGMISMGIEKWVKSRQWETVAQWLEENEQHRHDSGYAGQEF